MPLICNRVHSRRPREFPARKSSPSHQTWMLQQSRGPWCFPAKGLLVQAKDPCNRLPEPPTIGASQVTAGRDDVHQAQGTYSPLTAFPCIAGFGPLALCIFECTKVGKAPLFSINRGQLRLMTRIPSVTAHAITSLSRGKVSSSEAKVAPVNWRELAWPIGWSGARVGSRLRFGSLWARMTPGEHHLCAAGA